MRPWTLRLVLLCLLVALGGAAGGAGAGVQPGQRDGLERRGVEKEEFVPGELIVRFREDVSAAGASSALQARGARGAGTLGAPGLRLVKLPRDASVTAEAAALERDPRVLYAEPNYIYELTALPNDPLFGQLWGLHQASDRDIDAPAAWNVTKGSAGVTVAVIDSGVAYGHPDLAPNMWVNSGEIPGNGIDDDGNGFVDDVRGWDFVQNDATPLDYNGHGTHVAGTIGARGNNKTGVTGVNWSVKMMALRAAGAGGNLPAAAIVNSVNYACMMGADVVNGSFGGPGFSATLRDAIKSVACQNTLFVFAAGNSGWNLETNTSTTNAYPCEYHRPAAAGGGDATNLICVAATNQNDVRASFSNYGATAVHLAAPGVGTLSSWPAYSDVAGTMDGMEGTNAEFNARWGNRMTVPGTPAWGRATEKKARGSYSLADSPGDDYANNMFNWIDRLVPMSLSGRVGCRVAYQMWIDSEFEFDWFDIWASSTGANPWVRAGSWTGYSNRFVPITDDISAFDGGNVFFRLLFESDEIFIDLDGVHIDDLHAECLALNGSAYEAISGTSMATPHVAGVAALYLAANPSFAPEDVKAAILGGVDPRPGLTGVVSTGGRLNAARTLGINPDDKKPNTTITAGPKGNVMAKKATFKFKSSEGGSTFQCKHMKGAWQACKSPKTYKRLGKGKHTFQVRAIDKAGNVDPTPAKRTWAIL
ncbi:MAG TPA: S8 family serine peptidase [Gaiellaceae bacterium]|nr:S8 family serine peptidase [Gaiellaceae bacterium]